MATIAIFAPELTGQTGLTLQIRTLAGVAVNSPVDSLTESPSSSGRFTADVTESIPAAITHAAVFNSSGRAVREGWIASGETFVQDNYPSSGGGGSGSDPLENAVPGSYAVGTAGYKIGLITAAAINSSAPVAADGTISEIIIGDDYKAANGRAFSWTIEPPTGFVAGTSECSFGGKSSDGAYTWLVTGTITQSGSNWVLSFDLPGSATATCKPGFYDYSVEVKHTNEITKVRSRTTRTKLVEKQT